jgi:hypothetical protein
MSSKSGDNPFLEIERDSVLFDWLVALSGIGLLVCILILL